MLKELNELRLPYLLAGLKENNLLDKFKILRDEFENKMIKILAHSDTIVRFNIS